MSDEEKNKQDVGNIKDVRPDFDEEEQARKEVEEEHDLVAGDVDIDEVEEQREAEKEEQAEESDQEEDEDEFLDILCRRPDQSGGSCGSAKTSMVADNQHSKRYRCEVCKGVWTVQTGGAFPY